MNSPVQGVLGRRLVCENLKFNVYFDHVVDTVSSEEIRHYLVVAPKTKSDRLLTGVAVLPIVGNRVGLLRVYRHAVQNFVWEIPRGFLEDGGTERDSALRELREETGLQASLDRLEYVATLAPESGTLAARVPVFIAHGCISARTYEPTEFGHREFRFFRQNEIIDMIASSEIEDPYTLVAFWKLRATASDL